MHCISCFLPSPPLLPHLKSNRRQFSKISSQKQRFASLNARAIQSPLLLLAATSPAKAGDVSVLLQTGSVLLIVYFIANFIVPEFIMKSHRSGEIEEQRSKENAAAETDAGEGGIRARRNKQGFGSNKR